MVDIREFGGIPSDDDVFGQEAEQHSGGNSRGYLTNWKESSQLWQTRSHSNKWKYSSVRPWFIPPAVCDRPGF
jgi:hypothetical protein